jgi:arylsulfatase A-like enzyme
MNRPVLLAMAILLIQTASAQGPPAGVPSRPNILVILADDMGSEASALYPQLYDASSPSGHGQVATPTLSTLAARGLVFDNVWATPLCSPTRAAILSGLYGHNTTVTTVNNVLPGTTTSIFELMASSPASSRYAMAVFGKWHLGGFGGGINHVMKDSGVPLFKGFLGSHVADNYNWSVDSSDAARTGSTVYSTSALTDFAIEYIRQRGTDPWFVYLPYGAPHGTMPDDGFQVPPAGLFSRDVGDRPAGDRTVYSGVGAIPVYQAMIQALDTEIGRLLHAIDEAGQTSNTLIIFLGDNGTPAPVKDPASRIRGSKWSVHEGGVRVPMVVAGAGVSRRGREAGLVTVTDLYATIAHTAGVSLQNNSINNSHSLVPLFTNDQAVTGRTFSFAERCPNNAPGNRTFAIRDQRYKLLYDADGWQMFDLGRDPWEATNVFGDAQHAAARGALLKELAALQKNARTPGCFVEIPAA